MLAAEENIDTRIWNLCLVVLPFLIGDNISGPVNCTWQNVLRLMRSIKYSESKYYI